MSRVIKSSSFIDYIIISNIIKNELEMILQINKEFKNSFKLNELMMLLGIQAQDYDNSFERWAK